MTWINYVIATGRPVEGLVERATAVGGGPVWGLAVGPAPVAQRLAQSGVERVVWFETAADVPAEALARGLAAQVTARPGLVWAGRTAPERVLLGAAAAALRAPVLTDAVDLWLEDDRLVARQAALAGRLWLTLAFDRPVAILLEGGPAQADQPTRASVEIVAGPALTHPLRQVDWRPRGGAPVDLKAARRVVAVGRGLKAALDLGLIEALAEALGAEVACSRPLAEGLGWLPKDRYVGVSGQQVSPQLYCAVGLSGQAQHLAGARTADLIVAINSDPDAPVMAAADYILCGDLYQLVPALTEALS
ncbi:MAG: electron transfer flavoprotein subunit alpha/FixB family protein [Propionibacteriaceae bacterium]|jgi:electron transfer flavoprotein alpha subunit|nr:electron transfer flavoprotein subunit alpha/FixB family protein [Propionibacteriaceae bacterium]